MKQRLAALPRQLFLGVMALGWALIALASLEYFDPDVVPAFVIEKLPVQFEALWLGSLKLHVASALLSFPLCLVLMTRWLQRRRAWHRWLGRIAGISVVGVLVPTGAVLSLEAKGGTFVALGFLVSAAIVLTAMVYGIQCARRGALVNHARAMRHVVAQMSVAVTSRALLIGLDMAGMEPGLAYVIALWLPVLGSVLAAEWVSGRRPVDFLSFRHPLQRNPS